MKSRFLRALLLICCSTSSLWLTAQPSTLCIESVISVANGNTTLNCEAGGTLGVIKFTTTRVPTPHVYIVTDTEGNILKVSLNNTISFDGLNEGMMRVYAVSFLGQVLAVPGGNIFTDQLGSICYHLSANYIEITNVLPDAGLISLAPDGGDDIKLCLESSSPGPVAFQTTGVTGNYAYLITDADGNILAVTPNPSFDFTGYDIGQYQVYGLAYFGNLAAAAGLNVFTDDLSDGCFGITPGPISVEVLYPDGGQLKFLNTQDETIVVCDSPNDTASTMINYTAVNPIPVSFAYFLTDPAGTILAILDGSPLDADSALPYGESRIWGLSYMGDLLLTVGGNITDFPASSDCYDFSDNVLSVIRTLVDGGAVQFEGGGSSALVCGGDNAPDLLAFTHQTTAAAAGKVGQVRRDPMAMLPICGYNMGDYFAHWLSFADSGAVDLPPIYCVNWFRVDADGKFLWPGFGDNLRVLKWIFERTESGAEAGGTGTPLGIVPAFENIDLTGLDKVDAERFARLVDIDPTLWRRELEDQAAFLARFGEQLPPELAAWQKFIAESF